MMNHENSDNIKDINYEKSIKISAEHYIRNSLSCEKEFGKDSKVNNFNLSIATSNNEKINSLCCHTNFLDLNNNDVDSKNKNNKNSNARQRWKILARAIITENDATRMSSSSLESMSSDNVSLTTYTALSQNHSEASTRRFDTFDLIKHNMLSVESKRTLIGNQDNWCNYKLLYDGGDEKDFNINIHQISRSWTTKDLIGFNNTGNICVWPSEEALSYYVLENLDMFKDSWILELGGGMTCLAGLMLAKYADPFLVHLTDGNSLSLENVKKSVRLNEFSCFIKCSGVCVILFFVFNIVIEITFESRIVLKWSKYEQLSKRHPAEIGKYDFILSADCIFFDDSRNALVDTINYYLSANGQAFIIAPTRGHTMTSFINKSIAKGFKCEIMTYYNQQIWKRHQELLKSKEYDEDIHYPIFVKLMRNKKPEIKL